MEILIRVDETTAEKNWIRRGRKLTEMKCKMAAVGCCAAAAAHSPALLPFNGQRFGGFVRAPSQISSDGSASSAVSRRSLALDPFRGLTMRCFGKSRGRRWLGGAGRGWGMKILEGSLEILLPSAAKHRRDSSRWWDELIRKATRC